MQVYILTTGMQQTNVICCALNAQYISYKVLVNGLIVAPLPNLFYAFKKAGIVVNKQLHTYKKGYLLMP